MPRMKLVLAGLLCASPAFAQVGGGVDMNGGMGGGTPGGEVPGGGNKEAKALIDRAYVIPTGKIEVEGQYLVYSVDGVNAMMMPTTTRFDGMELGGTYGIADKLNAGFLYGFGTGIIGKNYFKIGEGALALFGNYELLRDKDLNVTGSLDLTLALCGGKDTAGDCAMTKELNAGVGARLKLTDEIAVFTGAPYGPGVIGQHLHISLEDGTRTDLKLPAGVIFQATPELGVYAATNLANIVINKPGMSMAESTFFGADMIPLQIGALLYLSEMLDLTAAIGFPNLKNDIGDTLEFSFGARLHI